MTGYIYNVPTAAWLPALAAIYTAATADGCAMVAYDGGFALSRPDTTNGGDLKVRLLDRVTLPAARVLIEDGTAIGERFFVAGS